MRIVIIGAGSVGRSIATELIDKTHEVVLVDANASAERRESVPGAHWVRGDAAELGVLGEARVGDEVVWTGRSTYLARGAKPKVEQNHSESDGEQNHSENSGETSKTPGKTGQAPSTLWRLSGGLGREYAAVSGDVNPIHLSALTAKAFGFPRTIVHGMWTHARALAALEGRLPAAYEVGVHFRKPVLLPSTVGFGFTQADPDTNSDLDFQVTNREGNKIHLTGSVA